MTLEPGAQVRLDALIDARPPLVRLMVRVELHNPGSLARWFMLPDSIRPEHGLEATTPEPLAGSGVVGGASPVAGIGPVNGAATRLPTGTGRVPIAHFQGQGGFYCLRLPARSRVVLHDVPLDCDLGPRQAQISVDVISGSEVRVGDEDAVDWFGVEPTCDPVADVRFCTGRLLAERWPQDIPELAVAIRDPLIISILQPLPGTPPEAYPAGV